MNKGDVHWFSLIATTKDRTSRTIILIHFTTISVDFTTISVGFLFPKHQDLCSMVIHHQVRIPRCCGRAKFQKLRSPRPAGGDFRVSQQNSLYAVENWICDTARVIDFAHVLYSGLAFFLWRAASSTEFFQVFEQAPTAQTRPWWMWGMKPHETTYIWKHRMMNGGA